MSLRSISYLFLSKLIGLRNPTYSKASTPYTMATTTALLRHTLRGIRSQKVLSSSTTSLCTSKSLPHQQSLRRGLRVSACLRDEKTYHDDKYAGKMSRTDDSIQIEYPAEEEYPHHGTGPVQGRGGAHNKRTLETFSLEGRVGIVTGGARGLGLVMSQALVISGADVALVDLNSTSTADH